MDINICGLISLVTHRLSIKKLECMDIHLAYPLLLDDESEI